MVCEQIPRIVVNQRGVDPISARQLRKLGLTDEQQLNVATENRAVTFTHDVDFLRMASHRRHQE